MHPLVFRLLKKLSVGALSQQLPFLLIEAVMPYSVSLAVMAWLAYWLPRSLWKTTPAPGLRRNQAIVSASMTMSAVRGTELG
jgi:hypothetical protein